MAKIKTRDTVKDVKVFDRAANVSAHMRNAAVKSKESVEAADKQAEQTQDTGQTSPEDYASDKMTGGMKKTADGVVRVVKKNPVKKASENINKVKDNVQEVKRQGQNIKNAFKGNQPKKEMVKRAVDRRTASRARQTADNTVKTARNAEKTIKQAARGADKTIKTASKTVKGTAKATRNTVKTAERTAKVAVKTTQQTVKATQRAAQAAARAAKVAAQAAKAAAKAAVQIAKITAKVIMFIIKAIIAATKALIAAIAAGGWIAVVIILLICLIGLLVGSVFGIFFSNESGGTTMTEVVTQINQEFSDKIDQIQNSNPHDYLVLNNSGNSNLAGNWRDVLAIYSVKTAGDEENGMEVVTLDDEKIAILREIFWDMNDISYSLTETTTPPESITDDPEVEETANENADGGEDEEAEPETYTVLTINVASKGYAEMSAAYNFTDTQLALLDELLLPEYNSLFMQLTGSYVNISLTPEELAALLENLPQNIDERRRGVVTAAYSLIGKVNYFWGGKSTAMGWDSRWGTPTKVTSSGSQSSGTVRPFGMDCSGYVTWAFCNAAGTADALQIIKHGTSNQYANCHKIEWSELLPGDIVFFNFKSPHVGIIIGKKPNGNVIIAHCSSSRNNVVVDEYSGPKPNGFCLPARPFFYD